MARVIVLDNIAQEGLDLLDAAARRHVRSPHRP